MYIYIYYICIYIYIIYICIYIYVITYVITSRKFQLKQTDEENDRNET